MIKAYLKGIVRNGGKGSMGVGLELFRLDAVNDEDVELTDSEADEAEGTDVSTTAIMRIYEEIGENFWTGGGITAKKFSEDLDSLGSLKRLNIHINCLGGDCHTAQAIHSIVQDYECQKKTSYIDGVCASAATLIASAADEVVARNNTNYMIHHPWAVCVGNAAAMTKAATDLEKLTIPIINVYKDKVNGKIDEDKIRQLMEEETWMTADEAQEYGFVDVVRGKINAIAKVSKTQIFCSGKVMDIAKYHYKNVPAYPFKELQKPKVKLVTKKEDNKMADTEKLTLDIMKSLHPELLTSIQTEARTEERTRLAKLDEMAEPGLEQLITAAKVDGRTPDQIAMEALTITRGLRVNNAKLDLLKKDGQAAASIPAGDAPIQKPEDKRTETGRNLLAAAQAKLPRQRVQLTTNGQRN
jgi:ATP-dependent Clp protease, protease subunit